MNLASLSEHNLAEHGEYERLVFEGRHFSNRSLRDQSARLATALSELGLGAGSGVVVMMPNCPEIFVAYEGIWRAGLVAIPVLSVLEANELRYILDDSKAKAIVTSPEVFEKIARASRDLGRALHVLVTGSPQAVPEGCASFDALVARSPERPDIAPKDKHDVATILYTSGTTGRPKGVMLTHHNIVANAQNIWSSTRVPRKTDLLALPLAHSFGLSVLVGAYLFGGKLILMRRFNPESALELIQRYKVTAVPGVPAMFLQMLAHPSAGRYDTSSVARWRVSAAPMPTEQLRAFEERFGGTMLVGYGLTEAGPAVAVEREGMPRKPGSSGLPLDGVLVNIVGDDGRELARGAIGEIVASGENVSPGYFNNPEATREAFREGRLFTGDMGYLDEDGYLFVVERKKDLIIRGGLNVYPKDVEEVIHQLDGVQEVAVVGVPDEVMGEQVCAYIVLKPGAEMTVDRVTSHCQSMLAKYKTPSFVEFVPGLPRSNVGKIQKKELRKLAVRKG